MKPSELGELGAGSQEGEGEWLVGSLQCVGCTLNVCFCMKVYVIGRGWLISNLCMWI